MGYLLALLTVFIWSTNILVAKDFASSLEPFNISFGRWVVATTILLIISHKDLWRQRHILLKHIKLISALALTGIILSNTLIYYAGETASPIDMGLLSITSPIFLVILSTIFLHIKLEKMQVLGIFVAIFGVIVIITNGKLSQLGTISFSVGDYYMLINSLLFASYSLLQYKRPANISQTTMLAATALVGVIIMLPFAFFYNASGHPIILNKDDVMLFLYLGIFNSVIAFLSWNTALAKLGNVKTSIIYYLMPIFSSIQAYYFLGDKITPSEIYGGLFVVIGVITISFTKRPKVPKT